MKHNKLEIWKNPRWFVKKLEDETITKTIRRNPKKRNARTNTRNRKTRTKFHGPGPMLNNTCNGWHTDTGFVFQFHFLILFLISFYKSDNNKFEKKRNTKLEVWENPTWFAKKLQEEPVANTTRRNPKKRNIRTNTANRKTRTNSHGPGPMLNNTRNGWHTDIGFGF